MNIGERKQFVTPLLPNHEKWKLNHGSPTPIKFSLLHTQNNNLTIVSHPLSLTSQEQVPKTNRPCSRAGVLFRGHTYWLVNISNTSGRVVLTLNIWSFTLYIMSTIDMLQVHSSGDDYTVGVIRNHNSRVRCSVVRYSVTRQLLTVVIMRC